ncbi:hydrogenase subunit MbhD domain-containing protein [Desulfurispira natronophila]|uniref:Multisubunit Na+/H+ antiporter MnhB subunit n=1 Tax=Desulfurispira natronophila TaxID=682562 RepID=A0A7W7Y4R7_9BACT|nr:hydrogenase subunit MbhD domain-containing protein [Desulfurispira natronophila]MBB5022071.1 multisubunit Na+/H+ antiporter MnhB subunit [Desulfurispira natronophila]
MIAVGVLIDVLLALGLVWLGWRTLQHPQLFRALVFFVVFGLVMAISWARLHAPDLALVEAAVGAGLTGALLLNTYRDLERGHVNHWDEVRDDLDSYARPVAQGFLLASVLALLTLLGWSLWHLPPSDLVVAAAVKEHLGVSGASHPVTAVLLNFRGYDTLLEIVVLFIAIVGVWSFHVLSAIDDGSMLPLDSSELLNSLVHRLVPLIIIVASYLLWVGAHGPGGAFQAGAVLASIGIIFSLTGSLAPTTQSTLGVRFFVALGLLVFLGVGLTLLVVGEGFLHYPHELAGALILTIELALMISIALVLVLLFNNAAGVRRR